MAPPPQRNEHGPAYTQWGQPHSGNAPRPQYHFDNRLHPGPVPEYRPYGPHAPEYWRPYPRIVAAVSSRWPAPYITSVTGVRAAADQTVIIRGQGFGNFQPFVGDVPFFMVSNLTRQWNAGNSRDAGGNYISVKVSRWTDNEIVFSGFSGAYGNLGSLVPGDQVAIYVWNVNTGYLDPVRAAAVRTTVWGDQGQAPRRDCRSPSSTTTGRDRCRPDPGRRSAIHTAQFASSSGAGWTANSGSATGRRARGAVYGAVRGATCRKFARGPGSGESV